MKAGSATITVTTSDGGKTAKCEVTVEAKVIPVSGITVDKETLSIVEGEDATLTATVAPEDASDKTFAWSTSDEKVATVDENGKVTAVAAGTATITATTTDGGKTAKCEVTVEAKVIPVEGVTVDKETLEMVEGEDATIAATVAPEEATDKSVAWSTSDEAVATVDAEGKVTAVAPGTATITVTTTDGEKTAKCEVTVSAKVIPVESVALDKETLELVEGDEASIAATVAPEEATDKTVKWTSSDETVATVDAEGKVTAVKAGTATITATTNDGGMTATCAVTVEAKVIPVEGVEFAEASVSVIEDEKTTISVVFKPETPTNKNVTFESSDLTIATVDEEGNVTGIAPGTATITVTTEDGGKTATCEVTVEPKPIPVSKVEINRTAINLIVESSAILVATVSPEDATNKNVVWSSSDESIVKVDQKGEVTAVKVGKATVTVTTEDGGKTFDCEVTVSDKPIQVTGVSIYPTSRTINVGSSYQLTANITPADATNHEVKWTSSNTSIATVDETGKVTAVKPGTATITVKTANNGKTATCKITVEERYIVHYNGKEAPSSIKYTLGSDSNNYIRFKVYDKSQSRYLSLSALGNVQITSNNTSVANSTGSSSDTKMVTAYKAGSATLTFKHSDRTIKTISLTVANPNLTLRYSTSLSTLNSSSYAVPSSLKSSKGSVFYMRFYDNDNKKMVTSEGYKVINGYANVSANVEKTSSGEYYVVVEYKGSGESPLTISHGSASHTFNAQIPGRVLISTNVSSYKAFNGSEVKVNPGQEIKLYFWDENTNMRLIPNESEVTLTSSNNSVATLSYSKSDGYIKYKGVASGIVRLTIKYKDRTGLVTGEWDGLGILIGEGGLGITQTDYSSYARLATGSETPPIMYIKKNGTTRFTVYNYDRSSSIPISSRLVRGSFSMMAVGSSSHINCSYTTMTIDGNLYPLILMSQTGGSVGETKDYEIKFTRLGESGEVVYKVRFKIID